MSPTLVIQLIKDAIEITLFLALPILGVGLLVGLMVGLFQALTQIQEVTLVFIPKIVITFVSLIFLAPWMMQKMMHYTEQLIINLPQYIR